MAGRYGKARTKLGDPVDINGLIRLTVRPAKGKGKDAIEIDFELLPFSIRRERKGKDSGMGEKPELTSGSAGEKIQA